MTNSNELSMKKADEIIAICDGAAPTVAMTALTYSHIFIGMSLGVPKEQVLAALSSSWDELAKFVGIVEEVRSKPED